MRLTCSQKKLANALGIISKAVDLNNTLPVLNNVLLKAKKGVLHFTSTNLELAITNNIEAEVKEEGEVTIPAKLFSSYVNYLRDENVEIEVKENDVQIKTKDSKTRIKGIASSEFPPIPAVENDGGMQIKVKDLKKAINQVVFAAALNTTRPILSGVYFLEKEGELKVVSTDSYRLSEKSIPVADVVGEIKHIIPAKTILELGAILDSVGADEEVKVMISKTQALFSVGKVELISRLIEGNFPNYEQIIPKSSKTKVEIEVSALSLILKRINIFAKENNNKIILKVVGQKMEFTTESTQYGEGEIVLDVKVEGGDNEIAVNSQFLLEALSHVGAGKIAMEIGEKVAPILIKPDQEVGYTHIIMPLKI